MTNQSRSKVDKVQIGACTLYCGKAQDIISDLGNFDCLISDPPYGINGSNGTIGKKRNKGAYVSDFDDTPEYIEKTIAPVIAELLEKCERGAITPGGTCSGFYPNPSSIGGYVQAASGGLCKWGACTFQPVFFYGRDPRIGKAITPITHYLNEHPPKVDHPCPKPQKAWEWLVNKCAIEGHSVIDPFMGAGATGIACAKLGMEFTGIEMEPKYFDIACRRIEDAYSQKDLFITPPKNCGKQLRAL